jgi:hypothetical protein
MKTVLGIFGVLALIAVAVASYFAFGNYSEGFRAGTVVKLSHKGMVFKTYEGQLNLGLVLNEPGQGGSAAEVSNIWEFSVPKKDMVTRDALEAAMLSGKRSKLHYVEKFMTLPWRGESKYLVVSVETLQ